MKKYRCRNDSLFQFLLTLNNGIKNIKFMIKTIDLEINYI